MTGNGVTFESDGTGCDRRRRRVSRRRHGDVHQHDHRRQRLGLELRRRDRQRRRDADAQQRHASRATSAARSRPTTEQRRRWRTRSSAPASPTASTSPASPPARRNDAGSTTAAAITNDLGNNIDQDGSCSLTKSTATSRTSIRSSPRSRTTAVRRSRRRCSTEARRSVTRTRSDCPPADQRGNSRPRREVRHRRVRGGRCSGRPRRPPATPTNITDSSADLSATINLHGEAGGFHFVYGTSPGDLSNSTDVAAAGVISSDTARDRDALGPDPRHDVLLPGRGATTRPPRPSGATSSRSRPCPDRRSSRTSASTRSPTRPQRRLLDQPPGHRTRRISSSTGPTRTTTAQQTQPVDVGSARASRDKTVDLTGLDPGSTVHFDVVASNDIQQKSTAATTPSPPSNR